MADSLPVEEEARKGRAARHAVTVGLLAIAALFGAGWFFQARERADDCREQRRSLRLSEEFDQALASDFVDGVALISGESEELRRIEVQVHANIRARYERRPEPSACT